ncbi:dephospho-CoA kinase [Colwellia echini]|uniref:Dephospho-CoA kinase n=1 Tax=Colwellia echini TaxID=1982103 RepID=A0ABY3MTB6_9GAMM|nr:dephospho-CoA kinase [Colwellia echini]TYK64440.1 dephospho-CoA kinase [Colwellia echini]
MSKLVIGLTGGIASGKTTITDQFNKLGIDIIDADIIARQVVAVNSPALAQISNHFGDEYILPDGQLNRNLLRNRIFANEADKLWLNNLLHPLIRNNIINQTKTANSDYCILVAPLLIENKLNQLVDRVLVVDVSEKLQIERTMLRDNSSEEVVKAIIASQVTRSERLKQADDVINNDDLTPSQLIQQINSLDKKYIALTKMV